MANPEHLKILKRSVEEWNWWRKDNPGARVDLSRADFSQGKLPGADLAGANLSGANLSEADFTGAGFWGASLPDANLELADLRTTTLSRADLKGTNLSGVDFRGADLRFADLRRANLLNADLSGADLHRAVFAWTHLHALQLRKAKSLETAEHYGPSAISSQTLDKSKGQIPDAFLKGCGLKDWEILAAKLHDPELRQDEITDVLYEMDTVRGRSPIAPYSVFISYNRGDEDFAEKLEQRLDKDGVRSWRDVHHMAAGPIDEEIDRGISLNSAVLLVLSKKSVESDWVEREAKKARKLQKEVESRTGKPRHILCPVALDDSWGTCRWDETLKDQIVKYNILNFGEWKDARIFESQYKRLRTGLKIYYRDEGQ